MPLPLQIAVKSVQVVEQTNMGRVYALKSVRVFYKKLDRMKFVSHLDMNRFMSRAIKKAGIPIWYTEGFHPHPYITFALPLSLGFESEYEIMDIRLTNDDYPLLEVMERLNAVFPEYVRVFEVCEPETKVGKIGFADFIITFGDSSINSDELIAFLKRDSIIVSKKTKKGTLKEIDISEKIKAFSFDNGVLKITLPAGSEDNLNPELLLNEFFENHSSVYSSYQITRKLVYDTEMNIFR